MHDAQLLLSGERQPAAAHAVAQGGVVELESAISVPRRGGARCAVLVASASPVGVWSADGETTSSHSR